jgi:hypothetical protein
MGITGFLRLFHPDKDAARPERAGSPATSEFTALETDFFARAADLYATAEPTDEGDS